MNKTNTKINAARDAGQTFRFSDAATSDEITAPVVADAVAKYARKYDPGEMEDGDTTEARIYTGATLMDLCAILTITADGRGGVKSRSLRHTSRTGK